MAELVRQALEEGAVGLSAGLEYSPGRWSTTDEVAALAAELAPYDCVYISHERAEGADPMWYLPSQHEGRPPTLQDAVLETIEIGRRTGVCVVASHIKAKGVAYWGCSAADPGRVGGRSTPKGTDRHREEPVAERGGVISVVEQDAHAESIARDSTQAPEAGEVLGT